MYLCFHTMIYTKWILIAKNLQISFFICFVNFFALASSHFALAAFQINKKCTIMDKCAEEWVPSEMYLLDPNPKHQTHPLRIIRNEITDLWPISICEKIQNTMWKPFNHLSDINQHFLKKMNYSASWRYKSKNKEQYNKIS